MKATLIGNTKIEFVLLLYIALLFAGCSRPSPYETAMNDLASDDSELRAAAIDYMSDLQTNAVTPLISKLKEPAAAESAVKALIKIGKPAIPQLIQTLSDNSVSAVTAGILFEIGTNSIPALITALRSEDLQPMSAGTLAAFGTNAINPLVKLLADANTQEIAQKTLERIGPGSIPALIKAMDSPSLHPVIINMLQKFGTPCIDPLITSLSSDSKNIRIGAAKALTKLNASIPAAEKETHPKKPKQKVPDKDISTNDTSSHKSETQDTGPKLRPKDNTDKTVAKLIDALKEKRSLELTCQTLVEIGSDSVEPLIAILNDNDVIVRDCAITTLSKIGDKRAVMPLSMLLANPDKKTAITAAHALGEIGDVEAVYPLINVITDNSISAAASKAIIKIGHPAIRPLLSNIDKGSSINKARLIDILAEIGDERCGNYMLKEFRTGTDPDIRAHAAEALGKMGIQSATEILITSARKEPDNTIRVSCIKALGSLGAPKAAATLIDLAHKDDSVTIRKEAIKAMATTHDQLTVKALAYSASNDESGAVRQIARDVLSKIRGAYSVIPFMALLSDQEESIREIAQHSLNSIRNKEAIKPFILGLSHKDKEARTISYNALTEIGAPAIPYLITELRQVGTRDLASKILVKIGKPAIRPLIQDLDNEDIDLTTSKTLIAIGDLASHDLLLSLKAKNEKIRTYAAYILIKLKEKRAVKPLFDALKREDLPIIAGAHEIFMPTNEYSTNAIPILIKSLYLNGFPDMATDFINSRNKKLETAGYGWAKRHGFKAINE